MNEQCHNFVIIIPAGGSGSRFGGDKLSADLCGMTVLARTVKSLEVLGAPIIIAGTRRSDIPSSVHWVDGGDTRTASVKNAFDFAVRNIPDAHFIVIHDGARPLIKSDFVLHCVKAAAETGVAVAAHRVINTIKQSGDDNLVEFTLDRAKLWEIETPQVIKTDLLKKAYDTLDWKRGTYTDDSQLVEAAGLAKIRLVENPTTNLKITSPWDLAVAKLHLTESH